MEITKFVDTKTCQPYIPLLSLLHIHVDIAQKRSQAVAVVPVRVPAGFGLSVH